MCPNETFCVNPFLPFETYSFLFGIQLCQVFPEDNVWIFSFT